MWRMHLLVDMEKGKADGEHFSRRKLFLQRHGHTQQYGILRKLQIVYSGLHLGI